MSQSKLSGSTLAAALRRLALLTLAALPIVALGGCSISSNGSKGNDDVKIQTPFGGMSVKTNEKATAMDTGIPVYPGATLYKDPDDKKDKDAADVNMNFGSFHLRVKAVGYRTPDPQDKVKAWYRKELAARYGDVIECRDKKPIGTPTRTKDGLTCDEDKDAPKVKIDNNHADDELTLRTGSKSHQHLVAFETKDGYTKLGLIELELPTGKGDKDSDSGRVSN